MQVMIRTSTGIPALRTGFNLRKQRRKRFVIGEFRALHQWLMGTSAWVSMRSWEAIGQAPGHHETNSARLALKLVLGT